MNRRDFAKVGLSAWAGGLAGCGTPGDAVPEPAAEQESKPLGVRYYEKAEEIWQRIASQELALIGEAADRAASTLQGGGKIYCQIVGGHMHRGEFRATRPGNPDYLHHWTREVPSEQFDVVQKGDFVFFDFPRPHILETRRRGAYTVGIRVPYYPNKTTPRGVLAMNELAMNPVFENVLLPEECADLILTSGVPFTDGVLFIPEIPAVRVCPIAPQGTHNFYWMLTAEIAARHRGGAAAGTTAQAAEFIRLVQERGRKIRDSLEQLDSLAKNMVDWVSQGARYWNYDATRDPVTGQTISWGIMVTENTNRASGLVMSRLLDLPEIEEKAKPGDFVFMAPELSDLEPYRVAARAFRQAGLKVIYIGSRSEGEQGESLADLADWHIDTHSPEREGALAVPGFEKKICPTTGVLYPLAQYMLNAQFIARMIEADMTPLVFMGMHLIGGRAFYEVVQKIYAMRGY